MTGKGDDAAALQQQITSLKTEGAEASAGIDRLKRERALATSDEEARATDDAIGRQIWISEHCAAALPGLEIALDDREVGSGLVGLAKGERAFICHAGGVPDQGYPALSKFQKADRGRRALGPGGAVAPCRLKSALGRTGNPTGRVAKTCHNIPPVLATFRRQLPLRASASLAN